jgi:hypothetical protein
MEAVRQVRSLTLDEMSRIGLTLLGPFDLRGDPACPVNEVAAVESWLKEVPLELLFPKS